MGRYFDSKGLCEFWSLILSNSEREPSPPTPYLYWIPYLGQVHFCSGRSHSVTPPIIYYSLTSYSSSKLSRQKTLDFRYMTTLMTGSWNRGCTVERRERRNGSCSAKVGTTLDFMSVQSYIIWCDVPNYQQHVVLLVGWFGVPLNLFLLLFALAACTLYYTPQYIKCHDAWWR